MELPSSARFSKIMPLATVWGKIFGEENENRVVGPDNRVVGWINRSHDWWSGVFGNGKGEAI